MALLRRGRQARVAQGGRAARRPCDAAVAAPASPLPRLQLGLGDEALRAVQDLADPLLVELGQWRGIELKQQRIPNPMNG